MSMVSELRDTVKAAQDAILDARVALQSNYTAGRHVSFVHEVRSNGKNVVLQGKIMRSWVAIQDDWDHGTRFFAMLELELDAENRAFLGKSGLFDSPGPYVVNVLDEDRDVTLIS
jgi:hypothetical protein